MFRAALAMVVLLCLVGGTAFGQTSPNWVSGTMVSAAQWNALWASKADTASPVISSTLTFGSTTATGFGTGIGQIPVFGNFQGSGFSGLTVPGRLIITQTTPVAADFTVLQLNRTTTFTGGSTISSTLRIGGDYGSSDSNLNWTLISSAQTRGTSGGLAVGGFLQANRMLGASDAIWGSISDAVDQNSTTSLLSGKQVVGIEVDVEANAADNGINAGSFGGIGLRKSINIVGIRKDQANSAQTEISHGLWITGNGDSFVNYQSAIGFGINTQIRNGLDTRGAITPAGSANPVSAVTMSAGHILDFNGPTTMIGTPRNYFVYNSGISTLEYRVSGVLTHSIGDNGHVGINTGPVSGVMQDVVGTATVGIRLSSATLTTGIRLAAGQTYSFDVADAHTLFYDTTSGKLFYAVGGVNKFSVDASGNVRAAGTLTASVTP